MRLALATFCLVAGCGTTISATQINPAPHAIRSRDPATVEVFTSGPPHDVRYVDVAFFEAEQESAYSVDDTKDFIAQLRVRAASLGCDGLVIGGVTNAASVTVDSLTPKNKKGLTATCIMYVDAAPTLAASTVPPSS